MMLQHGEPRDYVIGTGTQHSVQELVETAFAYLDLDWRDFVVQDERLKRPAEVETLVADPSRARRELRWEPSVDFRSLVQMMVERDLEILRSRSEERGGT